MQPLNHADGLEATLLVIRKRWLVVAVTFLAATAATIAFTRLKAPKYDATSGMLVVFGREHVFRNEVGSTNAPSTVSWEQVVNSELEVLRSRELVETVVRELTPGALYPDDVKDAADTAKALAIGVDEFTNDLDITSVRQSSVLRVTYGHEDAALAARAVNALVEAFKAKHLEVYSDPKSGFLQAELAEQQQQLERAEGDLESFRREFGLSDLGAQRTLLLARRADLEASQRATLVRISELSQQLAAVARRAGSETGDVPVPAGFLSYRPVEDAHSKLLDLRLKENELRARYAEGGRTMTALREEIRQAQVLLQGSIDRVAAQIRAGIEDDIASRRKGLEDVSRQLDDLDLEISDLDARERGLQQRERELSLRDATYKVYLGKVEDARITEDLDQRSLANIRVFEKAAPAIKPSGLPVIVKIALGAIMGMGMGVALAFLWELLAETFGRGSGGGHHASSRS